MGLTRDQVIRNLAQFQLSLTSVVKRDIFEPGIISAGDIFISGQPPFKGDGVPDQFKGSVPGQVNIETAQDAARHAAARVISVIDHVCGGKWEKFGWLTHVTGYVQTGPGFVDHKKVMDAASQLFLDVLGQKGGTHTRELSGAVSLPLNIAVEISARAKLR